MVWSRKYLRAFVAVFSVLASVLVFASAAQALVTDLSEKRIGIRYSFDGADLILFGAVGHNLTVDGVAVEDDDFDVVIVVKGPEDTAVVRMKEKVGPIWVNRESLTFPSVPGYYAVAASRPLKDIAAGEAFHAAGIGFNNLSLFTDGRETAGQDLASYKDALNRLRTQQELYRQEQDTVIIIGEGLFRTNVRLPANVPVGEFSVDAYVFKNGQQLARDRITLEVDKEGFERAVYTFAHNSPFLYGLFAVFIALVAGWLAGVLGGKK